MSSPLAHKFITLIALPIVLIAQLLCVCATHVQAAVDPKPVHACCASKAHESPTPKHDEGCPHCARTVASALSVADARVDAPAAPVLDVTWVAPVALVLQSPAEPAAAMLAFLTDPSPPPDVLAATCVLLI